MYGHGHEEIVNVDSLRALLEIYKRNIETTLHQVVQEKEKCRQGNIVVETLHIEGQPVDGGHEEG